MSEETPITQFQARVVRVFFALPESESFLLAGGLALAAHGLSHRPTQDFDAFTSRLGAVSLAHEALARAAAEHGWRVETRHESETFVRLVVAGDEQLLVDLALDSEPAMTPVMTRIGPAFAPDELAARKFLALVDRAMPRDFVDVYRMTRLLQASDLYRLAQEIDPGLDESGIVLACRALQRYRDEDLPMPPSEVPELRRFFESWLDDLA